MILTPADYRAVPGLPPGTDEEITNALAAAQERVEEVIERRLDDGEHTEPLPVDDDGLVWPSAYPVTAVSAPADAAVQPDGFAVQTAVNVPVGGLSASDAWRWITGTPEAAPRAGQRPIVLLTYTGGPGADATPRALKDVIIEVAARYLRPANTVAVPAGATSVSMGGTASQSFSGATLGGFASLPPEIRVALRRYVHPHSRRMD